MVVVVVVAEVVMTVAVVVPRVCLNQGRGRLGLDRSREGHKQAAGRPSCMRDKTGRARDQGPRKGCHLHPLKHDIRLAVSAGV